MRVLAVSPHLDDVAFSVGDTLAALADSGHDVTVVTCFTATVPRPAGFALACQLDKGLAADADYMALRRAEDAAAMAVLGARPVHLRLPEAPHRGYAGAADLFAGVHEGDDVCACYATQLGFPFDGVEAMRASLAVLPEVLLAGDRARAVVAELGRRPAYDGAAR